MKVVLIIFAILAVIIGAVGMLFKFMHWPGAHLMIMVSGVLILISAMLILVRLTQKKHL